MIIPENEIIHFKNQNELKKSCFYKQGFIISIIDAALIGSLYIFFKSINVYVYFGFVALIYLLTSLIASRSLYKQYSKYFGSDEIAISDDKLYYNICMNIKGNYQNFDSFIELNQINEMYIRKGWNPPSLVIMFKDGSHIAIHSLKNIEKVLEELNKAINNIA